MWLAKRAIRALGLNLAAAAALVAGAQCGFGQAQGQQAEAYTEWVERFKDSEASKYVLVATMVAREQLEEVTGKEEARKIHHRVEESGKTRQRMDTQLGPRNGEGGSETCARGDEALEGFAGAIAAGFRTVA